MKERGVSAAMGVVMRGLRRRLRTPTAGNLRAQFAADLRGGGVEIGGLHNPVWVPPGARVLYIDKLLPAALGTVYPDVHADQVVAPDVLCDTHTLDPVQTASQDFVIASHVLEHLHNPIKAMLAWHRVLKPGGLVLCIVPDARFTFDEGRPLTTLDHLLWDYLNDGTEMKRLSDLFHIAECNLNMHEELDAERALDLARTISLTSGDTHFHVWTYETFQTQIARLIRDCGLPFEVVRSRSDGQVEMLFLLRALQTSRSFRAERDGIGRAKR